MDFILNFDEYYKTLTNDDWENFAKESQQYREEFNEFELKQKELLTNYQQKTEKLRNELIEQLIKIDNKPEIFQEMTEFEAVEDFNEIPKTYKDQIKLLEKDFIKLQKKETDILSEYISLVEEDYREHLLFYFEWSLDCIKQRT